MKLLFHTRFHPNVGGIETVAALLAREWVRLGIDLIVATDVVSFVGQESCFPFKIIRRPRPGKWLNLLRWSDAYLQFNVSLKVSWPLFVIHRPFFVCHHSLYTSRDGNGRSWLDHLKIQVASRATNIFVSEAARRGVGLPGVVIPNPFDSSLFGHGANPDRKVELAIVGRLVSEKGADLLLRALLLLKGRALRPRLTVIGDGPERAHLEKLASENGLIDQVNFAGMRSQADVAQLLSSHCILVIPSLCEESFGVVALEGLASGCVVLAARTGGLPEAVGPAGLTFRRGDEQDLAEKLAHLLTHRKEWQSYKDAAPGHLALHNPTRIAARYIEVFHRAISRGGKQDQLNLCRDQRAGRQGEESARDSYELPSDRSN
jgi:glycosyltransferase involved in cell wall biosynthesis